MQKKQSGKCYVSTVLFADDTKVLHDRLDLSEVKPLTDNEYGVGGCTALLDAIGGAIHHIGNIHKYARKEDVPAHTLFLITTDGMENASHNYSSSRVKEMIKKQEEKYGWGFIFIAANIDAVDTAEHIGIRRERAANYLQSPEGTRGTYESMCEAISSVRMNCPIENSGWREKLDNNKK